MRPEGIGAMRPERIAIVGGGIAGLATAWFLARRALAQGVSRDVLLVERERLLGTHSTARNAAILRTAMPDPLGEALARESAEFLRRPPAGFSDVPLVDPCGLVVATARADEPGWTARIAARDDVEELAPARLAALAPHVRGPAVPGSPARAWLFPREGRIDNAALVAAFERGARAAGVRFRTGARVRAIERDAGRVRGLALEDGSRVEADTVVLAAGGWAAQLGRSAGSQVELRPTRRHLLVTSADPRVDPRWPVVWFDGEGFYARPESGGLLLSACDEDDVDPDRLTEDPDVREDVLAKAARHLPALAGLGAAHFWAGVRTLTADDRFVVGPDADVAGLFWVAGLGGHGMTSSAAVGRIAAEWILDGRCDHPAAAALAPARLAASPR